MRPTAPSATNPSRPSPGKREGEADERRRDQDEEVRPGVDEPDRRAGRVGPQDLGAPEHRRERDPGRQPDHERREREHPERRPGREQEDPERGCRDRARDERPAALGAALERDPAGGPRHDPADQRQGARERGDAVAVAGPGQQGDDPVPGHDADPERARVEEREPVEAAVGEHRRPRASLGRPLRRRDEREQDEHREHEGERRPVRRPPTRELRHDRDRETGRAEGRAAIKALQTGASSRRTDVVGAADEPGAGAQAHQGARAERDPVVAERQRDQVADRDREQRRDPDAAGAVAVDRPPRRELDRRVDEEHRRGEDPDRGEVHAVGARHPVGDRADVGETPARGEADRERCD